MDLLSRFDVRLAIALGIGLLVGAERERRKAENGGAGTAGIRTFALVSLMGGVAAAFESAAVLVGGGAFVAALTVAGYMRSDKEDRGLTSEVALILSYLLGALAMKTPAIAAGAGVIAAMVLAMRTRLHRLVKEALSAEELVDMLIFGVAALVVLPLVPNRTIGPYNVINPFTIWRLVVVVMGITSAGYVAQRIVGPRYGLPIAGLASGFVSSSATIAAMGNRAKQDDRLLGAAVAGAACSTIATIAQLAIVIGAASPAALRAAALPLSLAGAAAVAYGGFFAWRAARIQAPPESPKGHAFSMKAAVFFALMVSGVMLLSTAVHHWLGDAGLLVAVGAAGLADAHSAAASVASVQAAGEIDERAAVMGILVAASTNSATKVFLAVSSGPRPYAIRVGLGVGLVIAAAWAGLLLRG
jgi:uncharacterized membrane protein (DUF4010 family)